MSCVLSTGLVSSLCANGCFKGVSNYDVVLRDQEIKRSRDQEIKRSRDQEIKRSRDQEIKRSRERKLTLDEEEDDSEGDLGRVVRGASAMCCSLIIHLRMKE